MMKKLECRDKVEIFNNDLSGKEISEGYAVLIRPSTNKPPHSLQEKGYERWWVVFDGDDAGDRWERNVHVKYR